MKKRKFDLKRDTVNSKQFHVGIELELKATGDDCNGDHDDDACWEDRCARERDNLESSSNTNLLRDYFNLDRDDAERLSGYFNSEAWIDDYMSEYDDGGCDDDDCGHRSSDGESVRDEMESDLKELIGNESIKIVSDSSINKNGEEIDAEVCWNYFASKETIKDNAKIIDYLTKRNCKFDTSCGLHINLNNYLKVPSEHKISTHLLSFLFDFVADSRKSNSYCNRNGMSGGEKYSMIYNQGDRLEFRFFSPTLNAEKLNHYVTLANTVYKRLAGVKCKLPKKTYDYFLDKMIDTNNRAREQAIYVLERVNSLPDSYDLSGNERPIPPEVNETLIDAERVYPDHISQNNINAINCIENHANECQCTRDGEIIEREEEEAC